MFQHLCHFFLTGLGSGGYSEIESMYRIVRQSTKRVSLEWVKSSQLGRQKADFLRYMILMMIGRTIWRLGVFPRTRCLSYGAFEFVICVYTTHRARVSKQSLPSSRLQYTFG